MLGKGKSFLGRKKVPRKGPKMGKSLCPHLLLSALCDEGNHPGQWEFRELGLDNPNNESNIGRAARESHARPP